MWRQACRPPSLPWKDTKGPPNRLFLAGVWGRVGGGRRFWPRGAAFSVPCTSASCLQCASPFRGGPARSGGRNRPLLLESLPMAMEKRTWGWGWQATWGYTEGPPPPNTELRGRRAARSDPPSFPLPLSSELRPQSAPRRSRVDSIPLPRG